jgi:hypothetical protein
MFWLPWRHDIGEVQRLEARVTELEREVEGLEARRPLVDAPIIPYRSVATKSFLRVYSLGLIKSVAVVVDIDARLLQAVAEKESDLFPFAVRVEPHLPRQAWYRSAMSNGGFDPDNLWNAASYGLMQILFVTAREQVDISNSLKLLADPTLALRAGAIYLQSLMRKYRAVGDALSAYNAGTPTGMNRESYVNPILDRYAALRAEG